MNIELMEPGESLPDIANKEYIGRAVIVGRTHDETKDIVSYFPSGRSDGSRARFLDVQEDGSIRTIRSTEAKPGKGNPALIYYNSVALLDDGGIVLTNGAQTDLIVETYEALKGEGLSPVELLQAAFRVPRMMDHYDGTDHMTRIDITSFEPDSPNYTPRVSAVLGQDIAGMCLAWCNNGQVERQYFDVPLVDGFLRMLPTYTGQNVPDGETIPHFEGSPITMPTRSSSASDISGLIWTSLGPKEGDDVVRKADDPRGNDFRVGVATITRDRETGTLDYGVINKNKPMREGE